MDIQSEKLDLINWLSQLTDEKVIARIKALRNEKSEDISLLSESNFDQAYARAEQDKTEGRIKPHTEVQNKYKKWL